MSADGLRQSPLAAATTLNRRRRLGPRRHHNKAGGFLEPSCGTSCWSLPPPPLFSHPPPPPSLRTSHSNRLLIPRETWRGEARQRERLRNGEVEGLSHRNHHRQDQAQERREGNEKKSVRLCPVPRPNHPPRKLFRLKALSRLWQSGPDGNVETSNGNLRLALSLSTIVLLPYSSDRWNNLSYRNQ